MNHKRRKPKSRRGGCLFCKPHKHQRVAKESKDASKPRNWRVLQEKVPKPDNRSIAEVIQEISDSVPDEEWEKLPTDGAKNLDHYLYGHKKKNK